MSLTGSHVTISKTEANKLSYRKSGCRAGAVENFEKNVKGNFIIYGRTDQNPVVESKYPTDCCARSVPLGVWFTIDPHVVLTSTLSFSLQDFEVFRSIDPREYIYKLWNFGPKLTENLRKFSEVRRKCYSAAKLERNTWNYGIGYGCSIPFSRAFFSLQIVNKEMFWVVTEICSETNLVKRMKLIKAFIKIASE